MCVCVCVYLWFLFHTFSSCLSCGTIYKLNFKAEKYETCTFLKENVNSLCAMNIRQLLITDVNLSDNVRSCRGGLTVVIDSTSMVVSQRCGYFRLKESKA